MPLQPETPAQFETLVQPEPTGAAREAGRPRAATQAREADPASRFRRAPVHVDEIGKRVDVREMLQLRIR